ncbi:TatD family hydrolase [candidate division KSB1 bacterium]|nr:TatD family hydrolase [candidate division KSB1 bacterium]
MLIETHAHLYFDQFDEDREQVIQRADEADVKRIINIAVDLETSRQCIELAEKYEGLYATVGIHPNDSAKLGKDSLLELGELCGHKRVVAIGEIGMDFYWDRCPAEVQERAFREQIRLAKEVKLPIVIHNREAGPQIIEILKSEGASGLSGVFHCFSEDMTIAKEVLDFGFHISFTGNLTFKKSQLPEVAEIVPLDKLLLETDCPFLSPEPKRGRRNEPAHVVYIAQKLAEIKKVTFEEITEITTSNAKRLFGLGDRAME